MYKKRDARKALGIPFALIRNKLSESHNPLVGLSRPLPSSWPGGRVSARNLPAHLYQGEFF